MPSQPVNRQAHNKHSAVRKQVQSAVRRRRRRRNVRMVGFSDGCPHMAVTGMSGFVFPGTTLILSCPSPTPDPCVSAGYRCTMSTQIPTMLCCR